MSGQLSKALLDTFFERCQNKSLITKVVDVILPRITELACHFTAQHILKKCNTIIVVFFNTFTLYFLKLSTYFSVRLFACQRERKDS